MLFPPVNHTAYYPWPILPFSFALLDLPSFQRPFTLLILTKEYVFPPLREMDDIRRLYWKLENWILLPIPARWLVFLLRLQSPILIVSHASICPIAMARLLSEFPSERKRITFVDFFLFLNDFKSIALPLRLSGPHQRPLLLRYSEEARGLSPLLFLLSRFLWGPFYFLFLPVPFSSPPPNQTPISSPTTHLLSRVFVSSVVLIYDLN